MSEEFAHLFLVLSRKVFDKVKDHFYRDMQKAYRVLIDTNLSERLKKRVLILTFQKT